MVEKLLQGDDNTVCATVVRVVGGKGDQLQRLRRPIQHLVPIEVRAEERQDTSDITRLREDMDFNIKSRSSRNHVMFDLLYGPLQ